MTEADKKHIAGLLDRISGGCTEQRLTKALSIFEDLWCGDRVKFCIVEIADDLDYMYSGYGKKIENGIWAVWS
jgi:hypothetical protein